MLLKHFPSIFAMSKKDKLKINMKRFKRETVALLLMMITNSGFAQRINGNVVDKKTGEPLIGATVQVEGCDIAAVTDASGKFSIAGLKNNGAYNLIIKYISYQTRKIDGVQSSSNEQENTTSVALKEDEQQLGKVTITAVERKIQRW